MKWESDCPYHPDDVQDAYLSTELIDRLFEEIKQVSTRREEILLLNTMGDWPFQVSPEHFSENELLELVNIVSKLCLRTKTVHKTSPVIIHTM